MKDNINNEQQWILKKEQNLKGYSCNLEVMIPVDFSIMELFNKSYFESLKMKRFNHRPKEFITHSPTHGQSLLIFIDWEKTQQFACLIKIEPR